MKNKFFILTAAVISCAASLSAAGAACYDSQRCTGSPNAWSQGGVCGNQVAPGSYAIPSNYGYSDAAQDGTGKVLQAESTEKFSGVIKSVNKVALPNQNQVQVVLGTDRGDLLIIVGPAQFVDQAKIRLQAGDKITVTGYKIKANGNDVILAADIKGNGGNVQLLDENRQPVWGGKAGEYRNSQNRNFQYQSGQRTSNYQGSAPSNKGTNQPSTNYSGTQHPYMPNSR